MKSLLSPVLLACLVTLAGVVAAAGFPRQVHYVSHEKVDATIVKGGRLIEDGNLSITASRAMGRGSEMHDKTNHVFIIVDGEAEFVTGGKITDPKVTAPGQTRGSGIEGGVVHHLSKGDVIVIPANTPHQWKDTSKTGSVGFYGVNYED